MALPRTRNPFARLSRRLQHHFGGDNKVWFPSAAGGTSYTVAVDCRQASDRGASRDMTGFLQADAGTIRLQAEKADFPFAPAADQLFRFGPAGSSGTTPDASCLLYQITEVSGPEQFSHYEIMARRH